MEMAFADGPILWHDEFYRLDWAKYNCSVMGNKQASVLRLSEFLSSAVARLRILREEKPCLE